MIKSLKTLCCGQLWVRHIGRLGIPLADESGLTEKDPKLFCALAFVLQVRSLYVP